MTKIINLDELLPADKKVELNGVVYTLPGDIPTPLYLKITGFEPDSEEAAERQVIENLYNALLELFQYGNPDLTELPLSLGQTLQAIGVVYGGAGDTEDDADAARPPKRTRGGATKSGQNRKRTTSRS